MMRALITLAVTLSAACAVAQTSAPQPKTVDEAREQAKGRKSAPPTAAEQVAVLTLTLDTADGAVRSARVDNVEVVRAVPPKVFARSRGDWEVRLVGEETTTYRMVNPALDIEIENAPGSEAPFSRVQPSEPVTVPIVVPLSRDGKSLGVRMIQIVDAATGRTIVETPIRQ